MTAKNDGPLSPRTLLGSVIATVLGGVLLAIVLGQVHFGGEPAAAPTSAVTVPPTPTWPAYEPVVKGSLRWNDAPLIGVPVQLCAGACTQSCDPAVATTVTDNNGEYRFVQPFQTGAITYTLRAGNGVAGKDSLICYDLERAVIDRRDPTTFKQDFIIVRDDLVILQPKPNSVVDAPAALQWAPYQGAASYKVMLLKWDHGRDSVGWVVWEGKTRASQVDLPVKLAPGEYTVNVTALGKYDSDIAWGNADFRVK